MKVATIGSLIPGLENMATGKLSCLDLIMMFRKTRQIEMRHSGARWGIEQKHNEVAKPVKHSARRFCLVKQGAMKLRHQREIRANANPRI